MKVSVPWISIVSGIALSLALPLSAQEPPAEIPTTIGETIDVRVVNVETVVTNASGERVRGLAAGDFRILVDGVEVPVEYFAEVEEGKSVTAGAGAEGAPAAPVAAGEEVGRNYLVYVDDSFALATRRNVVLEKVESDLSLLKPADRMAILAYDGNRLNRVCGWTGDAAVLRAALAKARSLPSLGGEMLAHKRALQVDVNWILDNSSGIDTGDSVTRVGGPKIYETEELFKYMNKRIPPEARTQFGKTTEAAAAALRGLETPPGRKVMLLLSGAWSLSLAPYLYGPLARTANQLGYTVYPVDTSESKVYELDALDRLARATGGRLVVAGTHGAFREVVADSGTYYWLGFTPFWQANDIQHAVTVQLRRPDLQVRSRTGFSDVSRRTQSILKAESVLLFGGSKDDQRLKVELGKPVQRKGAFDVPVTLGVPVEMLGLTPLADGFLAEVPLSVASEDAAGRRGRLSRHSLKVIVSQPPPAGTYARFQAVIRLSGGEQRLVFAVPGPVGGRVLWNEVRFPPGK